LTTGHMSVMLTISCSLVLISCFMEKQLDFVVKTWYYDS